MQVCKDDKSILVYPGSAGGGGFSSSTNANEMLKNYFV